MRWEHDLTPFAEIRLVVIGLPHRIDDAWTVMPLRTKQAPCLVVPRESHAGHVYQRFECVCTESPPVRVGLQSRDALRKILCVGIRIPEECRNLEIITRPEPVPRLVTGWRRQGFAMIGKEPHRRHGLAAT